MKKSILTYILLLLSITIQLFSYQGHGKRFAEKYTRFTELAPEYAFCRRGVLTSRPELDNFGIGNICRFVLFHEYNLGAELDSTAGYINKANDVHFVSQCLEADYYKVSENPQANHPGNPMFMNFVIDRPGLESLMDGHGFGANSYIISNGCYPYPITNQEDSSGNYPNNYNEVWNVPAPPRYDKITLEFSHFETEIGDDILTISDNYGHQVDYSGMLCVSGVDDPLIIELTNFHGDITVEFDTDWYNQEQGFYLKLYFETTASIPPPSLFGAKDICIQGKYAFYDGTPPPYETYAQPMYLTGHIQNNSVTPSRMDLMGCSHNYDRYNYSWWEEFRDDPHYNYQSIKFWNTEEQDPTIVGMPDLTTCEPWSGSWDHLIFNRDPDGTSSETLWEVGDPLYMHLGIENAGDVMIIDQFEVSFEIEIDGTTIPFEQVSIEGILAGSQVRYDHPVAFYVPPEAVGLNIDVTAILNTGDDSDYVNEQYWNESDSNNNSVSKSIMNVQTGINMENDHYENGWPTYQYIPSSH